MAATAANRNPLAQIRTRTVKIGFSVADQAFSVAGMFVVNVALARTITKQEYGVFTLCYSTYVLVSSLHTASIVEPFLVFGSGRYRETFDSFFQLIFRLNAFVCAAVAGSLFLGWLTAAAIHWHSANTLLGMAIAVGAMLTAIVVRRTFYVEGKPALAAKTSFLQFAILLVMLWITWATGRLSAFTAFVVVAVSWTVSLVIVSRHLPFRRCSSFLRIEPRYWSEHWKYARWVLATAFVFQITYQGYYWIVAGFLSVREVADLRAIYMITTPVDQFFIALSYIIVPRLAFYSATGNKPEFYGLWKRYCLLSVLATGSLAVFLRVAGARLLHVLYGGRFDNAIGVLYVMAVGPIAMGIGNTIQHAMQAAERPKFTFYAYVASGLATFVLGIPLVMYMGLKGAAFGIVASGCVYALALSIGFQHISRMEFGSRVVSAADAVPAS